MKVILTTIFILAFLLLGTTLFAVTKSNRQAADKLALVSADTKALTGNVEQGEYVAVKGGCVACHTHYADGGEAMAGGVPIDTPFGTFYTSNITSDIDSGIGGWTLQEFLGAMTVGLSPQGEHYYPAFPYTAYSTMTEQDLVDLKAWLDTVSPVETAAQAHDLNWMFSLRSTIAIWKSIYFDPMRSIKVDNTGGYLVNGPGHCAECHSPRNWLGGLSSRQLTGNDRGPGGAPVPGITSADLSDWAVEDLEFFLEVGMTVSGDFTGGHMTDVIDYGTSQLTLIDRKSIAQYLLSEENSP